MDDIAKPATRRLHSFLSVSPVAKGSEQTVREEAFRPCRVYFLYVTVVEERAGPQNALLGAVPDSPSVMITARKGPRPPPRFFCNSKEGGGVGFQTVLLPADKKERAASSNTHLAPHTTGPGNLSVVPVSKRVRRPNRTLQERRVLMYAKRPPSRVLGTRVPARSLERASVDSAGVAWGVY
ncbi:hypothetical protein CORC01_03786 [Colletotrichum orchidophilum]|uniref:Uncharacterized protein n=1 Tax=Colletotrichum orchidophilum TaxID=1209926 RepID=A0A1G4BI24_9PEZI|nr:uncharacterized protein CORC01_03786 [Colletotrichum orchidophilum]OHF00958.1 hypothetical protein CORC01_03786 [Colletotrichum orchidophilum]